MNRFYSTYQYLLYKYYKGYLSLNRAWLPVQKERAIREAISSASFILALLVYTNFLSFLIIIDTFTGYNFLTKLGYSKLTILAPGLFFMLLNYFVFIYKRKYKNIINKFDDEKQKYKIIGTIFAWSYVVFSIGSCFGLAYLVHFYSE